MARSRKLLSLLLPTLLVPSLAIAGGRHHEARVLSSKPIYQTVSYSVPVEQCRYEQVAYHEPGHRSATPALLGAVIGGALGNAVGHSKRNKQVGVAVGAVLGASVGSDIGRRHQTAGSPVRYGTERVCSTVHEQRHEDQLVGYRVTYRYAGQTYVTDMDYDPGPTLPVVVHVRPLG
ncbi:MAG: glycine zipper 2TM domain-containing protein [Pseudomonadales bacterium]|nr:glycine zipper 2TM domain-containing protein [Pseudomonadales bacterium]